MGEAMAVFIPTNSPSTFTKAPPLLPGFTAASVCIKDSIAVLFCFCPCACPSLPIKFIFLLFAETIPAVTVDSKLKGLPTAITHSPIKTESELAKLIAGSSLASTFTKAKSVSASRPIIFAL